MKKLNKTTFKNYVTETLANEFMESGIKYTCDAVIHNACRESAYKFALEAEKLGFSYSKSRYFPLGCTRDIFLQSAAKEVYNRLRG